MNILKCNHVNKISEEDRFNEGCIGEIQDHSYEHQISGKTLDSIKQEIINHLGCDLSDLTVNPCEDEPNRIDAEFLENKQGMKATEHEIELWSQGQIRLWLCTYSFCFELVTTKQINLLDY